jgi:transmembrane 9 superfamily member 2/4
MMVRNSVNTRTTAIAVVFSCLYFCSMLFGTTSSNNSNNSYWMVNAAGADEDEGAARGVKVTTNKAAILTQEQLEGLNLSPTIVSKIHDRKRLTRRERKQVKEAERDRYIELRKKGIDEVSNTKEATALRNYKLRNKKRKGMLWRKREASLADVLFPGVSPEEYPLNERIATYVDLVESRKSPIPFDYYDLPFCEPPSDNPGPRLHSILEKRNLGSRLQGHDLQISPIMFQVKKDQSCTPICGVSVDTKNLRWLRKLIKAQYRVQLQLDRLPVLMRSKEHNFALRGYPIGFQAPPNFSSLKTGEFYIFNHLKFVVTYHESPNEFKGIRITGFDVHPISTTHSFPTTSEAITSKSKLSTCTGPVQNLPSNYLPLTPKEGETTLPLIYSYEVEWVASDLPWSDRWDVYLVSAPDDDLHYFSIVNSLMIVIFLTGAIGTIMIRTLRKDIAVYNDMESLEDGAEETGWKLVHGDVFRPPQTMPMLLAVMVGTGAQIGTAFGLAMFAAVLKLLNPVQKGQTLTALLILFVLCGSVAGYVSARVYKFTEQKNWKLNIIMTAAGLPGSLVCVFMVLNIWLSFAGAATAVSFLTIIKLFLLWVCVSTPLVFIGGFFGFRAERIEVPTKTNQIARIVPTLPWHVQPQYTIPMGGVLPFGSVCIELAFIMSALWLHQMYYVLGFLLAVLFILAATCAQVSIVLTYLQLCAENHRWYWNSFWQCASAGVYLFLYSLWFLSSRLQMVGILPVVVYLTYMGMISICFGLVCGSVGFLSAFAFTRTIYGAVKVD